MSTAGLAVFMRRVVLSQRTMGAIAPTSASMARRMATLIPASQETVVVDLGAGTGAISAVLGPTLARGGELVAVDRDADLLSALEVTAPWARRVVGDARDLTSLLADLGIRRVDVVLSTLPWTNFDAATQCAILGQVEALLTPDGVFATVMCLPTQLSAGRRRFQRLLRSRFDEMVVSNMVWVNLPPARLLIARRPFAAAPTDVTDPRPA